MQDISPRKIWRWRSPQAGIPLNKHSRRRSISSVLLTGSLFALLVAVAQPVVPSALAADESSSALTVGENFPQRPLADQHGQPVTLGADTDLVLLSFSMSLSKSIHGALSEKDKTYLADHRTQYVSDIAKMPGIITLLFAGPKMRRYDFPIILNEDDEFGPLFPQEEEKITAIQLASDQTVESIEFFETFEEVEERYWTNAATDEASPAEEPTSEKESVSGSAEEATEAP